jgi:TIR domain
MRWAGRIGAGRATSFQFEIQEIARAKLGTMPAVFISYAHADDDEREFFQWFRDSLAKELRRQSGFAWEVFLDADSIDYGQRWRPTIANGIEAATFFVAFMSPSFFNSPACRNELDSFVRHEAELERTDLVFPIQFIALAAAQANDRLVGTCHEHQYIDWTQLRLRDLKGEDWRRALADFAGGIVRAETRGTPLRLSNLSSFAAGQNLTEIERLAITAGAEPVGRYSGDEVRYEGPFDVLFAQAKARGYTSIEEFAREFPTLEQAVPQVTAALVRSGGGMGAVAEDLLTFALGALAENGQRSISWNRVYVDQLATAMARVCDHGLRRP